MQLTLLFLVGLFVVRCEAEAPLPVRLAFRNVTASSTSSSSPSSSDQNECNIISLTILSSGDTIYLRESSTNIIHPSIITKEQSTNNTSGSQICLYQEMSYNASRLVSVSSTNNQISVYISINGSSYSIDNVSMALTTDVIELEPVQQQAQFRAPGGSCGVQSNESNVFDKRAEALTLSYVNNEIKDYYVEMYLVVDCDFYQRYRSNYFSYIAQILNYVNAIYRSQGIHIFVTALEVWSSFNRFTVSSDSELTLQNLVNYRSTLTQSHDVIHLLSGKTFDNNFGRAFINGLCIYSNSAGLVAGGAGYSALLTAAVMAHILGHNFGLEHDTAGCTCTPDAYCIMSTYFPPTPPQRFSTCTQSAFNKNLPFYQATSCLANLPSLPNSISLNTCGNGIVDAGEDCDPGLWDTTAACCDPVTCRFRPGARCASGRCCNKITCRPLMPATLCRQADNECDLPEYCDGISENCPDDRYKMSATLCDNNKGYCVNGICGSHDLQCRLFMGSSSASASTECYSQLNTGYQGTGEGYCSYIAYPTMSSTITTSPCKLENAFCGSLQCQSAIASDKFITKKYFIGTTTACNHGMLNLNLTGVRDPLLVPNGASCGYKKWCMNSVCQSTPSLPSKCSCNDAGVCNDLGNCHCNVGYSGKNCTIIGGCGGSVDSGPQACSNVPIFSTTSAPPPRCPSNYCGYGGTCIVNVNGLECLPSSAYCCRCPGDYLEPDCSQTTVSSVEIAIVSNTTFMYDYGDIYSAAFKEFESSLCQVVRQTLFVTFQVSRMHCRCLGIQSGSSIGILIIQGDESLPRNSTSIAASIQQYCGQNSAASRAYCNNAIVKVTGSYTTEFYIRPPVFSVDSAPIVVPIVVCTLAVILIVLVIVVVRKYCYNNSKRIQNASAPPPQTTRNNQTTTTPSAPNMTQIYSISNWDYDRPPPTPTPGNPMGCSRIQPIPNDLPPSYESLYNELYVL